MQRLCALAGVIAVVTFSSSVNATLIRMDDAHAGKDASANTTRAGRVSQSTSAGFTNGVPQSRGMMNAEVGLVGAMPSFIDVVGGALRRDELSFDDGAHFNRRTQSESREVPQSLFSKDSTLSQAAAAPLAELTPAVSSGWSSSSDRLVGEALAAAPEASTTGLLLTGLGLLWLLRRRNSRLHEVEEQAAQVASADDITHEPVPEAAVVTLSGDNGGRLRLPGSPPPQLGQLRRQPGTPSISIRRVC